VSRIGDLWLLGDHRLYCRSALDATAYDTLLETAKAAVVFTDPPYNVKVDGHVCGSGAIKHREFAMASGEMTEDEFTRFLNKTLECAGSHAASGAIIYACMDWRHMGEMLAAVLKAGLCGAYVTVNDTSARHAGKNSYTTQIGPSKPALIRRTAGGRRSFQRRLLRRLNFWTVPVAAHSRRKTSCASLRRPTARR